MSALTRVKTSWQEDAAALVLARVCAADATGEATGVAGEGYWVKQADLSTITCAVYDRNSTTPDTAIATPTVTISSAILDTPVQTNVLWTGDGDGTTVVGYNFTHQLPGTCFPTGNHEYWAEYKFTTTGGTSWIVRFEGNAEPVVTS